MTDNTVFITVKVRSHPLCVFVGCVGTNDIHGKQFL